MWNRNRSTTTRKETSKYAPKVITFKINPDKIKDVIGSGGKTINKIIDQTGVKIDIEDDGRVNIANRENIYQILLDMI